MASYGAVQVLASAATIVVAAGDLTSGQSDDYSAVVIQNRGPNSIYVGNDASVTTALGVEVAPGQAITYDKNPNHGIYALAATADQVTPADTRWLGEPR